MKEEKTNKGKTSFIHIEIKTAVKKDRFHLIFNTYMRSCTQLSRHISRFCSLHNSTSVEKRGPEKGTPSCAARSSEGGYCTWWNSRNTVDIRGGGGERGKSCVGKVSERGGLKKDKKN